MQQKKPIKQERELKGWSQERLAEEIGTTAVNVGRWERDVTTPSPYFRQKLCELFGKNAHELGLLTPADTEPTLQPLPSVEDKPAAIEEQAATVATVKGLLEKTSNLPTTIEEQAATFATATNAVTHVLTVADVEVAQPPVQQSSTRGKWSGTRRLLKRKEVLLGGVCITLAVWAVLLHSFQLPVSSHTSVSNGAVPVSTSDTSSAGISVALASLTTQACPFVADSYALTATASAVAQMCVLKNIRESEKAFSIQMIIHTGDSGGILFSTLLHDITYRFCIGQDGHYAIIFQDKQGDKSFSGTNTTIHSGVNQTNRIAVIRYPHMLAFFVNKHHLTSITTSFAGNGTMYLFAQADHQPTQVMFQHPLPK